MRYAIQRIGPAHALGFGFILGMLAGLMQTLIMVMVLLFFDSELADVLGTVGVLESNGLKWVLLWAVVGALMTWLAAIGFNVLARITGGLKLTLNVADGILPVVSAPVAINAAPAQKVPTMQLPRPIPPAPIPAAANQALAFSRQPPRLISQTMPDVWWQVQVPVTTIGSDPTNHIVLGQDAAVEAKHAEIRAENGAYVLYDLGAAGGVFVNNRRIQGRNLLKEGFQITIGNMEMTFHHT